MRLEPCKNKVNKMKGSYKIIKEQERYKQETAQEKKQELRNDRNIWAYLDDLRTSFNILTIRLIMHADMMPTSNPFGCYLPRSLSIGLLSNILDAL